MEKESSGKEYRIDIKPPLFCFTVINAWFLFKFASGFQHCCWRLATASAIQAVGDRKRGKGSLPAESALFKGNSWKLPSNDFHLHLFDHF